MNALAQNLIIEPIEDDAIDPAEITATLREEIADFEVERVEDRGENNAVSRWFMSKPLPEKAKIASAFSLGSLLVVAGLAMVGFAVPELAGQVQIAIVVITAVGALLGFSSLHFILERIIVPFNAVADGMTRLSQGEREVSVYGTSRTDEIGEMARALEVFVKSRHKLDQLLASKKNAAERREREQAEQVAIADSARREAIDKLAADFENSIGRVVGRVASASAQLQETATSMAIAAEQAATQTGQVASAMDQTQTGVTSAATASDEFAMSIDEISRQATHSAELARKANATAESADATISALSDSAAQVGQIVELIQSIAQKTNLLALNASIEAARGGEAGRGFAVVASEVKELASQTSRATQDVADQIRAIQGSTGNSVTALRSIGDQIAQLEATAVAIASAVDQQAIAGRDLARNIDMAARATDDVSASIDQVSETSVMTGAAASQVLSSATELEEQASSLRKDVDRFLRQVRAG